MKRLIVMRHAKSSWDSGASSDHARPLNDRGRRDAPAMGRALADRDWVPQRIFSSDSQRTRETYDGLLEGLGENVDATFTREFYHAGPNAVIRVCESLDESLQTVLVLGHNPGWEDVVGYLSGNDVSLTTANCALLEASGPWMEVMTHGAWDLVDVLRPKDL